MNQIEVAYLTPQHIAKLDMQMAKVIEIVEQGLAEHGRRQVENPPKPGIHATSNSFIHAMPAYFKKLDIGGLKWVSGYPDNRAKGLPSIMGLVILNDMETGAPVCMMDGTWITAVRTAAVSAVTAKYCARQDSKVLGVVGAGVQGYYNLLAIKEVLPGLEKVKITDIKREAAEKYKAELSSKAGVDIIVCDEVGEVAQGSDIIVTATQRLSKPIIKNEWFEPGCLGLGLEASRAWEGDAILGADKFVTDDWGQTQSFHAQGAFPGGLPTSYCELGSIINGECKGRDSSDQRILAINIGLALEDILMADYLYRSAQKKGDCPTIPLIGY
jgi:ornithine cyclodeaminase/alanine dehydrogenase-like protein (mu-crystallin family)